MTRLQRRTVLVDRIVRVLRGGRIGARVRRIIGRHPGLVPVALGALAFVIGLVVSLTLGIPLPFVHDETSYLLQADTFAHGRLTNPTHPGWPHLETMHVIHEPSYQSKYPPGQGLLLALGQRLGHPIVGVWLGTALMCATITWMLQAWLPTRWAAFGGLLTLLQFGLAGTWAQSYWGGALAATGGALLFGALRRAVDRPRALDAVVMAVGVLVLANSRPWEGLLVCLPAAILLLAWLLRGSAVSWREKLAKLVAPALIVLVIGGVVMLRYDHAVTGDALRLPYQVHEAQYAVAPLFLWQSPGEPPSYRHDRLRDFYTDFALVMYERQTTVKGYLVRLAGKMYRAIERYLLPGLLVPLLVLPWVIRRDRWMRFALVTLGVLAGGLAVTTFFLPHYAAPGTALVMVLVAGGTRFIAVAGGRRWPLLRLLPLGLVLATLAGAIPALRAHPRLHARIDLDDPPARIDHRIQWSAFRAAVSERLLAAPGDDLVLVHYADDYKSHWEWVYHGADIDAAPIVWIHEPDPLDMPGLHALFPGRRVWRLELERQAVPRLIPLDDDQPVPMT